MDRIHGHDIMNMMLESNQQFTKESLTQMILDKYGSETRFYTCSAEDMTAEQLVDFLEGKGKFISTDDGFNTAAEKICDH